MYINNYTLLLDVAYCAACGKHHEGLSFKRLEKTRIVTTSNNGRLELDYAALCPETQEPLFCKKPEVM